MDMQMPVMDGIEATQTLRTREAASQQRLPVVALTANAITGDRERCLAAGMDDYLAKPFSTSQLRAVLHRWLPGLMLHTEPAPEGRAPQGSSPAMWCDCWQ